MKKLQRIIKRLGSIFNPTEEEKLFDQQMYVLFNSDYWYDKNKLKETLDVNLKNNIRTLIYIEELGVAAIGKYRGIDQVYYMQVGFLEDAQYVQPYQMKMLKTKMNLLEEIYPEIKEFKISQNIREKYA